MRKRRFGRVLLLGLAILFAAEAESSAMVRRLFRRPACCERCDAEKPKGKGEDAGATAPLASPVPQSGRPASPPAVPLPPIEDRGPPADAKDLIPLNTP
jgi:hypothetical protein